jgi:hypothetical protein
MRQVMAAKMLFSAGVRRLRKSAERVLLKARKDCTASNFAFSVGTGGVAGFAGVAGFVLVAVLVAGRAAARKRDNRRLQARRSFSGRLLSLMHASSVRMVRA